MSTCTKAPMLKWRTFDRFDGAKWRQFESARAIFVATEEGRRLMAGAAIGGLLHDYMDDYAQKRESLSDTRQFIAKGGNASVFGVGDSRLVIKEKYPGGDDQLLSLYRMDQLSHALRVDTECPKWLDIPNHYGTMILKSDWSQQFTLIERIDDGVTVGDVLHYAAPPREPRLKESVDHLYGPITGEFQAEIADRYRLALGELRRALVHKYLSPDEFIPDIDHNPYNIVLEPLETPLDGSSIKFWVIDQ